MKLVPTGIDSFDRVLGGGVARPSMTLLAGDPGTGKTTLMLQVACGWRKRMGDAPVLYACSDQKVEHLEVHARRIELSMEGVHMRNCLGLSALELLLNTLHPSLLIVDTMHCMSLPSERTGTLVPPSVSDLLVARYAFDVAHARQMAVILVCGTTRLGTVPNQRALEYLFDRVLLLRMSDDQRSDLKGLRQLHVVGQRDRVRGTFAMGPRGLVSASS
jgi:DNA repair protein RadA/Sms